MLKQRRKLGEAPKKKKNQRDKVLLDEDEFGGEIMSEQEYASHNINDKGDVVGNQDIVDLQKERQKNRSIVDQVLSLVPVAVHAKSSQLKIKQSTKTGGKQEIKQVKTETVKVEEGLNSNQVVKAKSKSKSKSKQPLVLKQANEGPISSNWTQFLKKQADSNTSKGKQTAQKAFQSQYVALDCEFVECGSIEEVARVSIVGQNLAVLYQSYIKPQFKITDYKSAVSGITYTHIKGAPLWQTEKIKVQQILYRKIIVGHTVEKDLDVMGLNGWFGFKGVIDINKFSQFQENGKLQGLKRLAFVFLEKNIQSGAHSSLQDAKTTMELFKLKKDKILNQLNREMREQVRLEKKRAKIEKERSSKKKVENNKNTDSKQELKVKKQAQQN